jgi:peroxiredoxin
MRYGTSTPRGQHRTVGRAPHLVDLPASLAGMIEPGTQAPDFTLPDQESNDVSLSDYRGQAVVLYFYPKADTPGL